MLSSCDEKVDMAELSSEGFGAAELAVLSVGNVDVTEELAIML